MDTGRLDPALPITLKSFLDAGLSSIKDGIKVLGGGHQHFRVPLEIHATRFTQSAIRSIEEAGGRAVAVHHSDTGLRQLANSERFARKHPAEAERPLEMPKGARERLFYSQDKNRGYLSPKIRPTLSDEFKQRYQVLVRT